jgi:hypothetical protein
MSAAEITVVPAPNPSEGVPDVYISSWYPPFKEVEGNSDDRLIAELFRQVCDRLSGQFDIRVIPPLGEVAKNGVFNKREFSLLPPPGEEKPELDWTGAMSHASESYGYLLVERLLLAHG